MGFNLTFCMVYMLESLNIFHIKEIRSMTLKCDLNIHLSNCFDRNQHKCFNLVFFVQVFTKIKFIANIQNKVNPFFHPLFIHGRMVEYFSKSTKIMSYMSKNIFLIFYQHGQNIPKKIQFGSLAHARRLMD
jgi:hypothetical protein